MSATEVLLRERAALCDTLDKVGPEAPTLCEGWLTLDLAAHLVAREARSDAALGLVLPGPFAAPPAARHGSLQDEGLRGTRRNAAHRPAGDAPQGTTRDRQRERELRAPRRCAARASGEGPRPLDAEFDDLFWRVLGFGARLARRRVKGVALVLRTPDGREHVVSKDGPQVTLTAPPGELSLFMSGRKEAAIVTHEGDPAAYAIVLAADFGT